MAAEGARKCSGINVPCFPRMKCSFYNALALWQVSEFENFKKDGFQVGLLTFMGGSFSSDRERKNRLLPG